MLFCVFFRTEWNPMLISVGIEIATVGDLGCLVATVFVKPQSAGKQIGPSEVGFVDFVDAFQTGMKET